MNSRGKLIEWLLRRYSGRKAINLNRLLIETRFSISKGVYRESRVLVVGLVHLLLLGCFLSGLRENLRPRI